MSTQSQRRRQGRPPSHPPSRCQAQSQTRDRAVTAGALSHGATAAHRCRLTACARTSPPARSIWPRWRASMHSSAGGALRTRIAKQVRATLGDAHVWADSVPHANVCATRTPFSSTIRKPVLHYVAQTPSLLGHIEHNSWRRTLRQETWGQPDSCSGRGISSDQGLALPHVNRLQTRVPAVCAPSQSVTRPQTH
jgi:hypothetical protein